MVTFKLIKHKNRQKLCPENLPNLNQRQQLRRGHWKASGGNPALPSSVHRLKKEPCGAHLSAQTEWSSLSIKEPLRSTRLATGCHCYSTHTIASQPFHQGLDPDGTRAPLHLTSHRTVIPSGLLQKHIPYKSRKPAPLSACLYCSVSKDERKRNRREKKKRTTVVSHITGSPRAGL